MRIAVDTNVLVRYLTWDDEGQAIEAARAIEEADAIVVPTIVLCELVWVLKRVYRYREPEIVDIMRFPADCVNPPAGVNADDWIKAGLKGAKC